ncbi:unnamed protein product [Rhizoctonia solani]|uniref:Uncharacterized protein n=1 Tax=Rhizoctonia solani TaxID=456999 RepID=A0A8H2WU52_9AGAM|nr:unnamed protein product [Rhizoctonia solani]CAE6483750.1 unnamed protein product [Rhizoctonia solani]
MGRESARVIKLSSVTRALLGQRVRLVARVVRTDPISPFVWIEDEGYYRPVDISVILASDNSSVELFRQPRCHVMVTGYIERLEVDESVPPCPGVEPDLIIRAFLLQSVPHLDLPTWRESVGAREELIERARQIGSSSG